jgi:flagellar protein FlgJ
MRQLDVRALVALAPTPATAPAAPIAPAGNNAGNHVGNFSALMRDVQREVGDFIEHGAPAISAPVSAPSQDGLSAEGAAWRNALAPEANDAARQAFLDAVAPYAREAGERLGVAPDLIAAHAALESGWGLHPLPGANLFGIKAGKSWQGDAVAAATTEYEAGVARHKTERFRAYPDQQAAFRDYAQLLLDNPRYRAVLNTGSDAQAFARGLAQGGYATDPAYAAKLARVAATVRQRED